MGHMCCSKEKVRRGLWSPEEDQKLLDYITCHGLPSWSSLPNLAGLQRCGKSCRLRWINYLRPEVKRGSFSSQEDQIILDVHRMLGNRWSEIAKHLPGRTDNEVKNYWNSCIKKKLVAQGLDPNTHTLFKTTSTNPFLTLQKKPKPFKLPKNSHISYTPTTEPHKPRYRPNKKAYFHKVESSKSPNLVTESDYNQRCIGYDSPSGLLHPMEKARESDHSTCVREDCFGNFEFELDPIDDMGSMDDLLWNFGFTS